MTRDGKEHDDDPKKRILARRARFMTAAITTAGLTASSVIGLAQEGCGGDVEQTAPSGASDTGPNDGGTSDTGPSACLRVAPDSGDRDTGPSACLSPPYDSGTAPDTGDASTSDVKDTAPMACLSAPFDTGASG